MNWTKEFPSKAGIYFRVTPGSRRMVRQDFFWLDGKLITKMGNSGFIDLDHHQLYKGYWWLGPLPDVPIIFERKEKND